MSPWSHASISCSADLPYLLADFDKCADEPIVLCINLFMVFITDNEIDMVRSYITDKCISPRTCMPAIHPNLFVRHFTRMPRKHI